MLLALAAPALATEVATDKKFGIGVSSTYDTLGSVTGKYYFDDKLGLSFHAGTAFVYHGARVSLEGEFIEFADWPFARFDMYWAGGADVGLWTGYVGSGGAYPEIGLGGGVGVELQFHDVPAQVFVDAGASIYPVNLCTGYDAATSPFCLVQPRPAAGARWFF